MAFKARRLRVQLPCSPDTRMEAADERRGQRLCFVVNTDPHCGEYMTRCGAQTVPCYLFATHDLKNSVLCEPPRCDLPSRCGAASWCVGTADRLCDDRFGTACGGSSCLTGTHCYHSIPMKRADEVGHPALVDAEHLPLLRGRLEQRLREIDALAQELKDGVAAQLEEIDQAEQALRAREAKD